MQLDVNVNMNHLNKLVELLSKEKIDENNIE